MGSSLLALNMDQAMELEEGFTQVKLDVARIESIRLRLSFDFVMVNISADLWVFYKSPFVCLWVGSSDQHVTLDAHRPLLPSSLVLSWVHARCFVEARKDLWRNLLLDKRQLRPWRVRAQVWKPLDRLLLNGDCADLSASNSVVHLARHPSDHAPLKITFATLQDDKPRPFRFLNIWTSQVSLLEVIHTAWSVPADGSPWRVLCTKLLTLRRAIQQWNKCSFGNVFEAVKVAEAKMVLAETVAESENSEEAHISLQEMQAGFQHALAIDEQFWSQKACVKWLSNGDRNSKFFHAVVRQSRVQGMIYRIKTQMGSWVEEDGDIATEAIRFFSGLYSEAVVPSDELLSLIPPILTREENLTLEDIPSMDEVKRVVHAMDGDSVAGPDSFTFLSRPLSDRLADLLPKLVSPQQSGFVRGRNIAENYLLAQEVVAGIGKKGHWNAQLLAQVLPRDVMSSVLGKPVPSE
ncbi:uncharacterized protein LOC113777323 [Coffea eugenioides]|uniref:uncharacterized protein LOC113777323 n=1 Tax=Coffea eugenioides TaxID=49369 RepID=UPI000F614A28|nr:uncharacterized protein LOC113777323 [Coffea eugenioides]